MQHQLIINTNFQGRKSFRSIFSVKITTTMKHCIVRYVLLTYHLSFTRKIILVIFFFSNHLYPFILTWLINENQLSKTNILNVNVILALE